jgi:hypothetical protein
MNHAPPNSLSRVIDQSCRFHLIMHGINKRKKCCDDQVSVILGIPMARDSTGRRADTVSLVTLVTCCDVFATFLAG